MTRRALTEQVPLVDKRCAYNQECTIPGGGSPTGSWVPGWIIEFACNACVGHRSAIELIRQYQGVSRQK